MDTKRKIISLMKVCFFIALGTVAFNSYACTMYTGNPTRPNTIWVPPHCAHGCWKEGHYVKIINPPVCSNNIFWMCGRYDRVGNWIPGHWQLRSYIKVGKVC